MSSSAHPQGRGSGLFEQEIGIGTWAWGDRLFWEFGKEYDHQDAERVFNESLQRGVNFFDTAEVYGMGLSERILGGCIQDTLSQVIVASKFMPFPWRISPVNLRTALSHSLKRLGLSSLALYQIHTPLPPLSITTWMDAMAEVHREGLIQAIGVSNFSLSQTRTAVDSLSRRQLRLASNQVEYNLLNRKIERDGLLEYCNQSGIQLIAYSPLAQGLLTGKYSTDNPPRGFRGMRYRPILDRITPLLALLRNLADQYGGRSVASIALNWTICKGTFPIPGVKNLEQLSENLAAMGWRLRDEDVALLDDVSDGLQLGL